MEPLLVLQRVGSCRLIIIIFEEEEEECFNKNNIKKLNLI